MLVRTIVIGLCAVVLVGCATTEVSDGGSRGVQPESGGSSRSSGSSGSAEAADAPNAAEAASNGKSPSNGDAAHTAASADAADGAAETDTLWRAALVAGDHSLTRALAELAYPRYLPTQGQSFRSADAADAFVVRADAERAWSLESVKTLAGIAFPGVDVV